MNQLELLIAESGLDFLKEIEFIEKSPGRYFQKEKIGLENGMRQFYVILAPNAQSPIHNHIGENMDETHILIHGSGKFLIYDNEGNIKKELELKKGEFHPIFSTPSESPNHRYIAGPKGSITLALERQY